MEKYLELILQEEFPGQPGAISNCKNYAKIQSDNRCGGITACLNWIDDCIERCINYGEINAKQEISGGLVGQLNNYGKLSESINFGAVFGNINVGGITGWCYRASYIKNSYNTGEVNGVKNVGGIIGYFDKGYSSSENDICHNSYNIGTITGAESVGSAIGNRNSGLNNLKTYCKYFYYLKKDSNKGIGNEVDIENVVDGINENDFKGDSMIALLNNNSEEENVIWKKDIDNINNGYPILNWQEQL